MPNAWVLIRELPHYRRSAFVGGLKAAGYNVVEGTPAGGPGDVLVTWNRYWSTHDAGNQFEARGGTVLVAENGYLGRDGEDRQLYAIARHGHNGSGTWNVGGPERFAQLGVPLQPWRTGNKIVIRGQRGIGSPEMASPFEWHLKIAEQLKAVTKRPVQVVPHPGKGAESNRDHEDYLQDAHALVVWSSSVGVKALAMGVPVFYCAPRWICEGAAKPGIDALEAPMRDDDARLLVMQRMAWAQWTVDEIASGEPFRVLQ